MMPNILIVWFFFKSIMPGRIIEPDRIVISIPIPIERLRIARIRYNRVGGDELAD
jgi:hypothetical protein